MPAPALRVLVGAGWPRSSLSPVSIFGYAWELVGAAELVSAAPLGRGSR